MKVFVYRVRVVLVGIGKILPFLICGLALVSYSESLFALLNDNFVVYDNDVILNTPLSFAIANYFEYNIQMLVVLCIISIAIETCIYNKLSCVYLGINLYEKSYFAQVEWETEYYYIVIAINIFVSAYFVYEGISVLIKK